MPASGVSEGMTEEHRLIRTIIDHLPARIYVKDTDCRFVINNLAHLRSLGVQDQKDARGRTTLDFFPGERGMQAMADDRMVLSGGPSILNQEKSDFGAEGRAHWALTTKVPLLDMNGKIVGLVGISVDITDRKRAELELARRSAEMEADVRMASQIQEAFLPRVYPTFPRGVTAEKSALHFAHRYLPAATLGGDFFDVIPLSDTRCAVLVSDVMGHGVRAGLLTALISGIVEELGARADDPSHVLGEINRGLMPIVQKTGQPVFTTVFFGVIDTAAGTLVCGNAGHPPPFLLKRVRGATEEIALVDPEPAAGLMENFAYSRRTFDFSPGDLLLCYTDGLVEATDLTGRMFGEDRLRSFIARNMALRGTALIDQLVREVEAFTGRTDFDDDICLLVVERS